MAIHKILFASFLLCFLIESSQAATKERLFSDLKHTLEVTAKASKENVALEAGIDKVSITWKLSSTAPPGADADFSKIKVKLCYAPISQKDRPWRKTEDELFKDKTCPHKIEVRPYDNKTAQSLEWTVARDIPTGTYFVRAYAEDGKDHELAYGQSSSDEKNTNLFSVDSITGRHKSLDIASICFSVFSVVSLLFFFVNEKRKAKLEQSK